MSQLSVSSTPSRRERERTQRRRDILAAAEEVFAAKGYHDASIEAIAAQADYASGTIYLYFASKESLYIAVFANKISEMVDMIEARATAEEEPRRALEEAVRAQFEYHDQHRAFFDLFIREQPGGVMQTDAGKPMRETYQRHVALFERLVKAAQERKQLRSLEADKVAAVLLGMVIHTFHTAAKHGVQEPLQTQADLVLDLFFNGAAAR